METQRLYNDERLDEMLVYFWNCVNELNLDTTNDLYLDPNSERSEIEKLDQFKNHLFNVLEATITEQQVQPGTQIYMQNVLNRIHDIHKKIFNTGEYYSIQYMDPLETDEQKRIGLKLVVNGKEEEYPKFLLMSKNEIDKIMKRFKKRVAGKKYIYYHLYELFISEKDKYLPIPQNVVINKYAFNVTKKPNKTEEIDHYDKMIDELKIALDDFILRINKYEDSHKGITASAVMLLDMILYTADQQGREIEICLKDYMRLRGLTHETSFRQQLEKDLLHIFSRHFEYTPYKNKKSSKKEKTFIRINVFEVQAQIKESKIKILLTPTFYNLITNPFLNGKKIFMYFPADAFKINLKHNPNSYYFIRFIALHKRININEHNEHKIPVKSLIESNPNFTHTYKQSNKKRFRQFILDPFERDLNVLVDYEILKDWEYESYPKAPQTYEEFLESYIIVTWNNYPESKTKNLQQNREKHTERRRQQKADKKKIRSLEKRLDQLEHKINE